ncbi:MAG TPA: N-acylglucosamine 2-epimerase [Algoriphagus sp.]|jgi:N-acylglucosamine 2-epimerase|uniref:AGE family epimerase/isomerase n=1 Tax=unclassified Algoriphagus TaxID=2641541 RepID=UPI000C640E56|nr:MULTISPECIES: AGE family epimerase/isomerase [unclassified Algoriphagus]MAL15325.1 N-acylglucosamine 2-epimerase [Algoriphagus sp.]HAH36446.1 N-acylglucosamine 2-epimerase [Algoriphagus sp.]HAS60716.1 N-acylglucosamine 2-epimerase [Algoriphagus sp.]HAZ24658.1 N-acylglucosamine 2-epimerase [Algoriphagus sp.]HCB47028.1 N-acylglucosamine 2-epimerase [Algoriphagus sp.]|tara:strand:- start:1289 stop:2476 length:1188 start_codon:yes stop_codon:yes gene_type:complete
MNSYAKFYSNALLQNIIPFWKKNSLDREFGGYFTCLNQNGDVYDTDKFVWLQGRQVWTFAMLFNQVKNQPDWLEISQLGIDFLKKYGMDSDGNFYFSLNRRGKPLVQPYNIFSDCFASMAFAQYGLASQNEESMQLAKKTFENILTRKENPKGSYAKNYPKTRPLKNFSLPMILSNLCLELESVLPRELVENTINHCIYEVMEVFMDKESGLIYENILENGSRCDSFEGRLINPGHGIEAMWFMMDIAQRRQDHRLMELSIKSVLSILEYGWDEEYGGIFYFLDSKGKPPLSLEWDQKLWWVHLETLVALAKAYRFSRDPKILGLFEKLHNYSWDHFSDKKDGEWFGYLNRKGEVLIPCKGGKWKGCFHVPRAFFQIWKTFELVENEKQETILSR